MKEQETISKSIRFTAEMWRWCKRYAKENGGRSAASVVREAVKEKRDREEKEKQE